MKISAFGRMSPQLTKKHGAGIVLALFIITAGMMVTSCEREDTFSNDGITQRTPPSNAMVMTWNLAFDNLYPGGGGAPPPVLARIWAMYHLAMHDALNCITPRYSSYVGVPRDQGADPDAAVAQAAYDMYVALKRPNQPLTGMTALLEQSLDGIPDGDAKDRGIALGHAVTQAILTERAGDAPFVVTNYTPIPPEGDEPGEYRYLPPFNYALAGFHLLTPFFLESQDQFLCGPPDAINTAGYTSDYNEVKTLGAKEGSTRTEEQTEIGLFWSENSSRGWNEVTRKVIGTRNPNSMDAWKTARLFALVHAGIADAIITAMNSKYQYYRWRPISAIPLGDTDGNADTEGDASWVPLLSTPVTPAYPSGHGQMGASAGRIIQRFFDQDHFDIEINSGALPGVIRTYSAISDAVRDNSLGRIYSGSNFRKSAVGAGEATGGLVGDYIYEHALQPE